MRLFLLTLLLISIGNLGTTRTVVAQSAPGKNSADEPFAESFSFDQATSFMATASQHWTESRQCFACHTNYAYLIASSALSQPSQAHQEVRSTLEEMVEKRWPEHGPRWDAEVVMTAATLAIDDQATTKTLSPITRTALDRMWTVQRPDGGITWLKCGWPPMESDDDYGAAMIAIAVGAAPDEYRQTDAAKQGLAKLRDYLQNHPPQTLHQRAMLVWGHSLLNDLLTTEEVQETKQQLMNLQKPDGGWNLASLGDWKRGDDKEQDLVTSDGYATAFTLFTLERAGLAQDDPVRQKGIAWLKTHQRASGRWFTRSLNKDNHHFISHAGTAFALLVLARDESLDR